MAKKGIIDEKIQGKMNECISILNDLSKENDDDNDEKKESIDNNNGVSILKFKNIVNWRTYIY